MQEGERCRARWEQTGRHGRGRLVTDRARGRHEGYGKGREAGRDWDKEVEDMEKRKARV